MVTTTNLSVFESSLRVYIGDTSAPYTYSQALIFTTLVEAVRYLAGRWNNKYLIYSPDMLISDDGIQKTVQTPDGNCTIPSAITDNDVFRNCHISTGITLMDMQDQAALLLAAAYLLRRALITSTNISNWSTPDLSFSNVESSRALRDLIKSDLDSLDKLFSKKLGTLRLGTFPIRGSVFGPLDYIYAIQRY